MAVSFAARQRLRLILQSLELADDIIDSIDESLNSQVMINRIISEDVLVGANQVYLQADPVINLGVTVTIELGGEMRVL